MAPSSRELALSLLAAAKNHEDLPLKLASLKQVKNILLSIDSGLVSELLPYFLQLQTSPDCLVRKSLIEAIEEIGCKMTEHCYVLVPILLASLKNNDTIVARQSIVSGMNLFCHILEELPFQRGKVERWHEEIWIWMIEFKDAIFDIFYQPGSVGTRLLGLKYLETFIILFSSDNNNFDKPTPEAVGGKGRVFKISCLVAGHPILDSVALMSEANRSLGILLDILRSSSRLPASLTITLVGCLAAIAKKKLFHYNTVLSALLDVHLRFEMGNGSHNASVLYSLRSAFLGFLRCMNTPIIESRDRLLRALRAMNASDAADQVIRQADKMMRNNERASRDVRLAKDDQLSSHLSILGDPSKKRPFFPNIAEHTNGYEVASKRFHHGINNQSAIPAPAHLSDSGQDGVPVNGLTYNVPLLDSVLSPVQQMITMIGALLAEGERGAESLEILISNIQPDLLADIVIKNMEHLVKTKLNSTRLENLPPVMHQFDTLISTIPVVSTSTPTTAVSIPQVFSKTTGIRTFQQDLPVNADSTRDPRRDPRRLDPRRVALHVEAPSMPVMEGTGAGHSESNSFVSLSKPRSLGMASVEAISAPSLSKSKSDEKIERCKLVVVTDQRTLKDDSLEKVKECIKESIPTPEVNSSNLALSPLCAIDGGLNASKSDIKLADEIELCPLMEYDQQSPTVSNSSALEESCHDLSPLPLYVELTDEQQLILKKIAIERIIDSSKYLKATKFSQTRMALLARIIAQMDVNEDIIMLLQKSIILDYQHQEGHELVLQILYHLHTIVMSDSIKHPHSLLTTVVYEKFLHAVVKSLLDNFPASDKCFSRLLGEIPSIPDSTLKLLEDLCHADVYGLSVKGICDVDRVTQGLGAVWSLLVGRPPYRQACLNIALKCAVHSQDEIRSRAIWLVTNKLYPLSYITQSIEEYATNMLFSAVDQQVSDTELSQPGGIAEQRLELEVGSHETSISGSQFSDPGASENESLKVTKPLIESVQNTIFHQANCLISLYFSLCTKKASLFQLVFDVYGKAPKYTKQAFCRQIPILVRSLGSSCTQLLRIISDPPQGTESILSQVLQVLTEGVTPSSELIAIVKHLYETKIKDASILIPMLSSFSKNEVIPIFPRLVDLPLEKFQLALAHILQGSAHTGPALTPAEVLISIHDITPEKDGLPIKKITEVCSACFEQRTVFTQQVLIRALNHMVDQTPLPLLFMRTVIQAIDAFPTMVDFVMEILSKLVNRQVWKMPKLWVGFLKCVVQTQPRSFNVLLQLPPPQLESVLNKHANLRAPLAVYAEQSTLKSSLPSSILVILGLLQEPNIQSQSQLSSSSTSSIHRATTT